MRETRIRPVLALWAATVLPLAAFARDESFERTVTATADGEVVISNVSGTIDVRGWDRNEVHVSGELGTDVERVDVESSGGRTTIKVILPHGSHHDSSADLEIQVPKMSSVEASVVSADVTSRGILGTQRLKSVSGEIAADIAGDDSDLRSVSGDLTIRGTGKPLRLRLSSVSGNLDLSNAAGKLELVTVSGDARVQMTEASEVRGKTTSGSLNLRAKLTKDARVDAEAVSGDLTLHVSAPGGVSAEVETFSGDIEGCLASDVKRASEYGPGKRLSVRTVEEGARVRAKTLSGDVEICDK
jgi:DUF4097 and DUF4098 domain-containing protein YvlB